MSINEHFYFNIYFLTTMNTHTTLFKWMRRASGVVAVLTLTFSIVGQASARILFEDDAFLKVQSEGIVMDSNDNAVDDTDVIQLKFGNDGTDATFTYTPSATAANEDLTIDVPGNDINFSDDTLTTTGEIRFEGASHVRIREEAFAAFSGATAPQCNYVNEIAYDTTTQAIYSCTATGAPGGTWKSADNNPAPGSTDNSVLTWDVGTSQWVESANLLVDDTGSGSITAGTGSTVDFSNAGVFLLTQGNGVPGGPCTQGSIFYDTGTDTTYTCDVANAWVALAIAGVPDFEAVYAADGNQILTASTTFGINATNAVTVDSADASAGAITLTASNAAGGIAMNAGTAGVSADLVGAGNTTYAITNSGAGNANLTVDGTGDFAGTVSVGAYTLTSSDGSAGQVLKTNGSGTVSWQNDIDTNTTYSAGLDLDLGGTTFDIEPVLNYVTDITRATTLAGQDLTIGVTGATDSSVLLQSSGTGTDAIGINATAGGVTIGDVRMTGAAANKTVTLSVADSTWNATLPGNGIVDNINSFTSTSNGAGASNIGVEDTGANLENIDPVGVVTNVQDALQKINGLIDGASPNVEDMTFYPEYPDAVVYPDGGGDNKGTLESFYDNGNNTSYYNWTTTQVALQDMGIEFEFPVPPDYKATGNFTFAFNTQSAVAADNAVDVRFYNKTNGMTLCDSSLGNANAGWTTASLTAIAAGCAGGNKLDPGDIVRVEVKLYTKKAPNFADVGYLNWAYTN